MNANRYGLSSLDEMNGYLRAGVERPLCTDSLRRWGVGYGVGPAALWGMGCEMCNVECVKAILHQLCLDIPQVLF